MLGMSLGRVVRLISALAIFTSAPILVWSATASAQVVGPCRMTMEGVHDGRPFVRDAATATTPDTAIEVDFDSVVTVRADSTAAITSHTIDLEFPVIGERWTASKGVDSGATWSGTVNVRRYASHSVGLYKVIGSSTGPGACTGTAFVDVTGKNPLSTTVGIVATGVTAVGIIGVGVGFAKAGATASTLDQVSAQGDRIITASAGPTAETTFDPDAYWQALNDLQYLLKEILGISVGCLFAVPGALASTVALMVSGASGPGSPGAPGTLGPLPRARWGPRFSIAAMLGGMLASVGALVLLQQFAVIWPTRSLGYLGLVLGLLAGIVLPSLRRIGTVRRVNRIIGGIEQRLHGATPPAAREGFSE